MREDLRYRVVGAAFKSGEITTIREICQVIPSTSIAKDLGMNYGTFLRKMLGTDWPCMLDVINLARLLDVPPLDLCAAVLTVKDQEKLGEKKALINFTAKGKKP